MVEASILEEEDTEAVTISSKAAAAVAAVGRRHELLMMRGFAIRMRSGENMIKVVASSCARFGRTRIEWRLKRCDRSDDTRRLSLVAFCEGK